MLREARTKRQSRFQLSTTIKLQPTTHRDSYEDIGVSCPIKYATWYETRHRRSMQTEGQRCKVSKGIHGVVMGGIKKGDMWAVVQRADAKNV